MLLDYHETTVVCSKLLSISKHINIVVNVMRCKKYNLRMYIYLHISVRRQFLEIRVLDT